MPDTLESFHGGSKLIPDVTIANRILFCLSQENDRTTLFEQYREATNELSHAKLTLADIESQAANLQQELQIKSADMKRLTERIDYLERELQQVKEIYFLL